MTKKTPKLKNGGSLITCRDGRTDRCVGYLFHSPEHGTYDPALGRVDVTRREADIHNQRLSEALIPGLDERCALGMRGTFYYSRETPVSRVTTWTGDMVSNDVQVRGYTITFRRNGMAFRGRLSSGSGAFHFRRIS
jgi:hypothetical protein